MPTAAMMMTTMMIIPAMAPFPTAFLLAAKSMWCRRRFGLFILGAAPPLCEKSHKWLMKMKGERIPTVQEERRDSLLSVREGYGVEDDGIGLASVDRIDQGV